MLTIIDITENNHEIQKFSASVAYEMQFKHKESTHGTFIFLHYSLERLMNMNSLIPTHS